MAAAPSSSSAVLQSSDEAVIQFDNVHIGFAEGEVLRGLSFSARARETLILLGETGTGKTLALKLAAGLLQPDSGNVAVLGKQISTMEEHNLLEFRRQVGFVFQEGALFDSLTVGENVAYRLTEDHVPEEEIEPRVREVLKFVELEHTLEHLPSEISGGMRRRVSIARALITHPPIVLYDSPTAGLDPVTCQTIITLIFRLQDGFAMANFHFDPKTKKVTRDVSSDAPGVPKTRFMVLRDGRIYFEGTP